MKISKKELSEEVGLRFKLLSNEEKFIYSNLMMLTELLSEFILDKNKKAFHTISEKINNIMTDYPKIEDIQNFVQRMSKE